MASQYPPLCVPIVDPGNVPHFHVDGLAWYFEEQGIANAGLWRWVPLIGGDAGLYTPRQKRLTYTFSCAVDVQRSMRETISPIVTRPGLHHSAASC